MARAGALSGGNLQKALLARELAFDPKVLLAAQPTRGLDVGAAALHPRAVPGAARASGCGLLVISEDLEELLALSDRIAVMYEGRIAGVLDAAEATVARLGLLMSGAEGKRPDVSARAAASDAGLAQPRAAARSPSLATLVLCSGLDRAAGADVLEAYGVLFAARSATATTSPRRWCKAAPMIFTGLAVAVAFRAKFWNIGAEGQLLAGAVAAAFVGAYPDARRRSPCSLMALAGAAAGGAGRAGAGAAAGQVQGRRRGQLAAAQLGHLSTRCMALIEGPWKDPFSGYPISPPIEDSAELPGAASKARGCISACSPRFIAARLIWFLMARTTLGFTIRVTGENPRPRAMAASRVGRVIVVTALLSGALAGLAGVGEVGGVHFQVMSDLSPGYGYSGIVIAMLARLNPLGVVPAAIFLAVVMTGAEAMSRATGVPVFLADVIQGTALLAMLVALLFTAYRIRRVGAAGMSDVLDQIFQVGFLAAIIRIATPLVFATLGEMFSERAGVLNLGIEGIMLLSAMTGFTAAYLQRQPVARRAAAVLTGALMGCAACAAHRGARPQPACLPASA